MRMKQFPHRATFLKISTENLQKKLNELLTKLSEYYCILLVKDRAKTKCDKHAAFQIHWLQRTQAIVSFREYCATEEGQDGELTKELAIAADDVSNLILQAFDRLPDKN